MRVVISTIPYGAMRYPTAGDWVFGEDGLQIQVAELPDERFEFLVALHELLEAYLCKSAGVAQESVDAFDKAWERGDRDKHSAATGEPGDDHRAPYHRQHAFATMLEMMVAHELKVRWRTYEAAIEALE